MIDRIIKSDEFVSFFSDKNFFVLLLIGSGVFFLFLIIYIIMESIRFQKQNKKEIKTTKEKDFSKPSQTELDLILQKMEQSEKEEEPSNRFEDEQEAKAIISYQELLEANQKKEPVTFNELLLEDEGDLDMEEQKKFRNSEFISPVYGRMNQPEKNDKPTPIPDVFKEKARPENLDINLEEGEQFLRTLKEFRKNL